MARKLENYIPVVKWDGINTAKPINVSSGVTPTAGGATVIGTGTNVLGPNFLTGSGVPTIAAPQGSLYLRTDGSSVSTRAYINTNGSTTWTAISTVA